MARNLNKKNVVKHLLSCLRHDAGFYNPVWKWSSLPPKIAENYDLIKDVLNHWQELGHIEIFEESGVRYMRINSVPEE